MLPLILGGAGLGIVKHFASDKPKEERQRRLAAETARYSPWTKMMPQPVEDADIFGNVMQGGLTGASFAQGLGGMGGGSGGMAPAAGSGMGSIGVGRNVDMSLSGIGDSLPTWMKVPRG